MSMADLQHALSLRNAWTPIVPPFVSTTSFVRALWKIKPRVAKAVSKDEEGSCTNAYYCPFQGWTGWSNAVSQGTCERQSRYRDYNQHIWYDIQKHNCNDIPSSCGAWQYISRD
ncbi:uncharacterized protein LOC144654061 [Oculina patagonica]